MASVQSDLHSVRDQLLSIGTAIAQVQDMYSGALASSEGKMRQLETQIENLLAEKATGDGEIRRLQAENAELRRLLDSKKPDLMKAIDARNAAFRRLQHARAVIKDLLEEQKSTLDADDQNVLLGSHSNAWSDAHPITVDTPGGSSSTSGRMSQHPSGSDTAATSQEGNFKDKNVSSDESWQEISDTESSVNHDDDDDTVRPSIPPAMATVSGQASPFDSPSRMEDQECTGSGFAEIQGHIMQNATPPDSQTGTLGIFGSQDDWYIEYSRSPATARVSAGPLTYGELQKRLNFDDDVMMSIESLERMQDPCMHIHVEGDIMFVHQPVILEGPNSTYIINWGNETVAGNTKRYLAEVPGRPADSVFHVFVNPPAHDTWWYFGAHTAIFKELPSIFRIILWMRREERKQLCSELRQRWNSSLDSKDIARQIRQDVLQQHCIELRSDGLQPKSIEFTRDVLKTEFRLLDEGEDDN